MYSEHFPNYKGPPIKLLQTNMEVVEGKTFINAIYGDEFTYSGKGVIVSGQLVGFVSIVDNPEPEDIDLFFSPDGLEYYFIKDISVFFES